MEPARTTLRQSGYHSQVVVVKVVAVIVAVVVVLVEVIAFHKDEIWVTFTISFTLLVYLPV